MTNPYDKNKAISADEAAKIIPRAEFRVFGKDIIAGVQEHREFPAVSYSRRQEAR